MIYINLFNLFAKVSLDSKDFDKGINEVEGKGKGLSSAFGGIGKGIGTMAGVAVKAIAVAGVAVTGLAKLSLDQFAEYEQLVGGVETLFKDNSDTVQRYASNAFKTAGLSANEYMSTITGFSASLLQGLGGDTEKAAQVGHKAILDMSDNANKMGTSIDMIQNAYGGFAKQNFTMLDNLKLGFGGTKGEMERLLKEATKLSGVEYSIGNFSDIIEAIHVIQEDMDITGTTAKEAASTISGSFGMLKGAWANLLTGLADDTVNFDDLINDLIFSLQAFGSNLLPRVKIIMEGIGQLATSLAAELPKLIMDVLPMVIDAAINILTAFINAIVSSLPAIINLGTDISKTLLEGIRNLMPSVTTAAIDIITLLIKSFAELLPDVLQTGIDILLQLVLGLAETLPEIIPIAIDAILTLIDTLLDNIDAIIDAGIKLIIALADGLIKAIPKLIEKIPIIIEKLLMALANNAPKLIEMGIQLIVQLGIGLIKAIPTLLKAVPQIIKSIVSSFATYYSSLGDIGLNMVKGIWSGITGAAGWLMGKISGFASDIVGGIQGFFDINSPSRVMRDQVGVFLAQGIGVGFEDEMEDVNADIQSSLSYDFDTPQAAKSTDKMATVISLLQQLLAKDTTIEMDGRETMRVLSEYQDEFDIYNSRDPRFAI